ncbi:MAG TPA: hypothetical protein VJ952_07365 [Opitutales bacterium]|nr:hypothetical protein [Opitutales bacterium]
MKYLTPFTLSLSALLFSACGEKSDSSSGEAAGEASTSSGSGGGMALTTEIPPELIEGTPQPIKVPNLEQAPNSAPTLMVPEGTELLSAGKPVTGSDDFPIIGELAYITDGDKEAGEGYFVELMDGLQWVQIDLGSPAELQAIWVWHYHSQARAYHDVIVQVSNDPNFEKGVTTLFNNDYDNSAEMGKGSNNPYVETRFGKLIDAKDTEAQYVRLYSNGNTSNDMNHYIEVEVYGIAE